MADGVLEDLLLDLAGQYVGLLVGTKALILLSCSLDLYFN